jgi:regulatory protein
MTVITAITPSTKREGRFDLMADGRPLATLSLEAIERLGLTVGMALSEQSKAAVEHEVQTLRTYDRALNMLAFRARASRELRLALLKKGEPELYVDAALERLTSLGLLNDADYARQFARAKMTGPGLSKRRLQSELFRRGVARDVADAAIGEVLSDEAVDEDAIIEQVASKKLRTLSRLDPDTRRRRLYAFLARRGYEPDDIRRVLAKLLRDADESSPDDSASV